MLLQQVDDFRYFLLDRTLRFGIDVVVLQVHADCDGLVVILFEKRWISEGYEGERFVGECVLNNVSRQKP